MTREFTTPAQQQAAAEMYGGSPREAYGKPRDGVRVVGCADCTGEDHVQHWARSVVVPVLFCKPCKTATRHVRDGETWKCACGQARVW